MEIRQYAERILRSPLIEDKLSDPGVVTDLRRNVGEPLPAYPARADSLALEVPAARRTPFPGDGQLEEPRTRGEVLHFFANHELLALELMALILLRFPQAPTSFRRGLVETMRDEQRHLSMYLERMSAFGVAFGDVSVNDFFWRTIA